MKEIQVLCLCGFRESVSLKLPIVPVVFWKNYFCLILKVSVSAFLAHNNNVRQTLLLVEFLK